MKVHSSRLEQTEDRISELEETTEIKGKAERNMQELTNTSKDQT
jgi:hypothetical protein